MVGEVMFYGPGAGKLPTASAVCADIVDIMGHKDTGVTLPEWVAATEDDVMSFDAYSCARLFIFECACDKCAARCLSEFGDAAKTSSFKDAFFVDAFDAGAVFCEGVCSVCCSLTAEATSCEQTSCTEAAASAGLSCSKTAGAAEASCVEMTGTAASLGAERTASAAASCCESCFRCFAAFFLAFIFALFFFGEDFFEEVCFAMTASPFVCMYTEIIRENTFNVKEGNFRN